MHLKSVKSHADSYYTGLSVYTTGHLLCRTALVKDTLLEKTRTRTKNKHCGIPLAKHRRVSKSNREKADLTSSKVKTS